jgi:tyrosinase
MVYRLYEPDYIDSFAQFATTRVAGEKKDGPHPHPQSYLNLEFIHNNIHNWTGGFGKYTGHMAEVAVAGLDPIFFMHHCNVDRQFALWQALNPDDNKPQNWFANLDPPYYDDGTWTIKQDAVDTPQTALAPFHKNETGECFNSDDVKNWMKLGYSYPELQPWLEKYKDEQGNFVYAKYAQDIRDQLKVLYQPPTSPTLHASVKWDIIVNITYDRYISPVCYADHILIFVHFFALVLIVFLFCLFLLFFFLAFLSILFVFPSFLLSFYFFPLFSLYTCFCCHRLIPPLFFRSSFSFLSFL